MLRLLRLPNHKIGRLGSIRKVLPSPLVLHCWKDVIALRLGKGLRDLGHRPAVTKPTLLSRKMVELARGIRVHRYPDRLAPSGLQLSVGARNGAFQEQALEVRLENPQDSHPG